MIRYVRVPKFVEVSAPRLFRLRPRLAVGTSGALEVTSCCLRDRTSDRRTPAVQRDRFGHARHSYILVLRQRRPRWASLDRTMGAAGRGRLQEISAARAGGVVSLCGTVRG